MASPVQLAEERSAVTKEIGTALRHTLVYGLGGILAKAISFVFLPFYTHYLTPRDYGVLEILDLSMSLLGMFLNMGMTAALLRYYGAAYSEDDRRKVVGSTFVFVILTGVLVFLLGVPFVPAVTRLVLGRGVPPTYLYLSFAYFVLGYVGNIPYTYMRAKEASGTLVTLDVLSTLAMLVVSIYLIAGLHLSILGVLLSPMIVGIVKVGVLIRWMLPDIRLRIDWKLLRQTLAFGAPLILSNLTMFTLNFADRFFLQHFASLSAVGVYAVGYKFGYAISVLLIQPFNMMWQARMYMVYQRSDHREIFQQVFMLYASVLTFAGLAVALFSSEIIRLMVDPRYSASEPVVPVVAFAYVFLGLAYYLQLAMFLTGRTGLIGAVSVGAAAVNLLLDYVLIRRYGMIGAAWATVLGFLVLAAGSYVLSRRAFPLGLPIERVLRGMLLALGVYIASRYILISSLGLTLLVKTSLLGAFLVMLRLARVLAAPEIGTLIEFRTRMLKSLPGLRPASMKV